MRVGGAGQRRGAARGSGQFDGRVPSSSPAISDVLVSNLKCATNCVMFCVMTSARSTVARKPVPLDDNDLNLLTELKTTDSTFQRALLELAGPPAVKSEASILHALVSLGLQRVDEQSQLAGYAALAAAQDEDDRAFHDAMRKRSRGGRD